MKDVMFLLYYIKCVFSWHSHTGEVSTESDCKVDIQSYKNGRLTLNNLFKKENRLTIILEEPNVIETKEDRTACKNHESKKCEPLYFSEVDCLSEPQMPSSPLKIFDSDLQSVCYSMRQKLAVDVTYEYNFEETIEFVLTKIQNIMISARIGNFPFLNILNKKIDKKLVNNIINKDDVEVSEPQLKLIRNLTYSSLFLDIVNDVVEIEKIITSIISSFIFLPHLLEFMLTYKNYFKIDYYSFIKYEQLIKLKRDLFDDSEIISEIIKDYDRIKTSFKKYIIDVECYDNVILAICMNNDISFMLFFLINNSNSFNKAVTNLETNYKLYKEEIENIIENKY